MVVSKWWMTLDIQRVQQVQLVMIPRTVGVDCLDTLQGMIPLVTVECTSAAATMNQGTMENLGNP